MVAMSWGDLGTQFCLELAFGVLLGLTFIRRAPMGVFFQRLMGTVALLPLLAAGLAPLARDGASPTSAAALVAALGFPFFAGPARSSRRLWGLVWSTAWTGLALVLTVQRAPGVSGAGGLVLASLTAMTTGFVAGGVGLAMVVGHWYLTVPQLPISWLRRLNRFTVLAMVASAVFLGVTLLVYAESLRQAEPPLLGPWGLFFLGARVTVGLALPLLFAWMAAGSLVHRNTRSATGILYASTVLVLIGAAASLGLQDSYGMPL